MSSRLPSAYDSQILNSGLPKESGIKNDKVFMRRAHRLLRLLADLLKILPEKLQVHGVVLLNHRPAGYGGFSGICRGQYAGGHGEQVEVALKALQISHDQSAGQSRIGREISSKEALFWSYLKR
jgi:hypothetical protein